MQRDEPRVIDAKFEVVEPPYSWRLRFWPSVLWWVATIAVCGAAIRNIPTTEAGYVPLYVFGAAMISPAVRLLCAAMASSREPVGEQPAQLLRQRLRRGVG